MSTLQNDAAILRDLNGLEAHLLSWIKGQNHVIPRVCSVLERGQLGLQPAGKPLGSLLFLGPTGVGKTQLTLEFTRSSSAPKVFSASICPSFFIWTA